MKIFLRILSAFALVALLSASSCTTDGGDENTPEAKYWPTVAWRSATPAEQGMNETRLQEMMDLIQTGNHGIDSILVIHNGYLVWEEYPNDILYDSDSPHILYSVTKSVTSTLVGIAIDKGFIQSVDQKVVDFFTEVTIANMDANKSNMTVEHLLTMTAGFEWDEISYGYADSRNSLSQAIASGNYVQYVLDCPMAYVPGTHFTYNTGNTQVLSAIITRATGMSTDVFAQKYLFEPLGITSANWEKDSRGIASGGTNLYLTPRDMAKFGYLFLNNGAWDGKQIVSAYWVQESTRNIGSNYGYLWWVNTTFEYYNAAGYLGQRIFIAPGSDLICVITTSRDETNFVGQLFVDYVLESVLSQ